MNKTLGFFATALLALLSGAATAGVTGIAQVPLLNITGTGNVRPNIMLLYDNSGSMAWNYTPDNVNDSTTCRAAATMGGGTSANPRTTRACTVGNPPFNSADFNHQYYNPAVTYTPPVKWDGSAYASQTRAATGAWTSVSTDGFGVNKTDMNSANSSATNLATGFPDLRWCDSSNSNANCGYNTATYTYPDNSKTTPQAISSNPYYYTINVAEYCTDATLKVCQSVNVGAAAPAGYPVPAKVRWCDSPALTNCQAKYLEDSTGKTTQFIYPRFGNPNGGVVAAYGTITIGASANTSPLPINSVTVSDPAGATVITNGVVTAAGGTTTATSQATLATDLAASIINKTGLSKPYAACVKTPTGANKSVVSACSTYGINLAANNIVAVIPIDCLPGTTTKSANVCSVLPDDSRNGWAISIDAPNTVLQAAQPSTALITVSGSTNKNNKETLAGISLGSTALLPGGLTFGLNLSSSGIASAIAGAIGKNGTITAYVGGNNVSSTCASANSSTVCLVNTAANAGGQAVSVGALSNNTSGGFFSTTYVTFGTAKATTAQPEIDDAIPVAATPLGAGAAIFVRTDIVSNVNSYPKAPTRADCAGATCTYDEEMTNFANWYAYYKTRNQMMKTSVGQAFQALTSNYNVGIVSLSGAILAFPYPAANATKQQIAAYQATAQGAMTVPAQFAGPGRSNWYSMLYNMSTSGATPMRQALHAVGLMYANQSPYVQPAGSEVVSQPCQPNFTFITTDGYWNGAAAADVADNDNVENKARFCTRAGGCLDARPNGATLADVALYWYNGGSNAGPVSLRPDLKEDMNSVGLVPAAAGENTHLHMNTYALGLGVDGIMKYEPAYDTAPQAGGDFYKLVTGVASGCPWNSGGAYVWPDTATSDTGGGASYQSRVDDLWHSAINGHGKYFSAADPTSVVGSLSTALSNIQTRTGAAAAAATSTPNISLSDNDIFSATFTTVKWFGAVTDRKIDPISGEVGNTISWTTSTTLAPKVAVDAKSGLDGRKIYMRNAGTGALQDFLFASLSDTEKTWFAGKCSLLTQCATLSAADRAIVDDGNNLVNWLRGQQTYADGNRFRAYGVTTDQDSSTPGLPIVLGDVASAKPAYQREPRKGYTFGGYDAFRSKWAARSPTVFVAANDGMLHAFSAANGSELWAYAPRITMKKLYLQASTTYGTNHQFTTDGTPEIGDVQFADGSWHSVLVAGLNAGGRGYYALDVTDPNSPKPLWEICADTALCSGSDSRLQNLGLTFADPQFGTYKDGAGTHWAVFLTSGYNNVPESGSNGVATGDGHGYLYVIDVTNGSVLAATCAGASDCKNAVGSTDTPSGLAKVTVVTANPTADPLVTYVYGGDNLGNMWRFDFTKAGPPPAPTLMGVAVAGGAAQPVTSRPEVTMCAVTTTDANKNKVTVAQRVVAFGTGRLLDVPDLSNKAVQSVYVLKDSGSGIAGGDWRGSQMAQRTLAKTADKNTNSYTIGGTDADLGSQLGWYMDLDQNSGERVNLDPKVVSGTLSVVTNIPTSSSACTIGGTSNVYQLDVCTGAAVAVDSSTGSGTGAGSGGTGSTGSGTNNDTTLIAGHTLSASSAAVGYIIVRLPSGALKMITTLADGTTVTSSVVPAKSIEAHRAGWRRVRE